uniref:Phosphopantothenate--cysteine ligase n=1 Tax=Anas zonorhyncha TaxID=75864 RepID=A0A8B9UD32_9AVES
NFLSLCVAITMKMVPKMLSPLVKEWAPKAFVISFKLETDPLILIDKSLKALEKYRHQVVVANILESRRTSAAVQNCLLFYSLVMVIVDCFEKVKYTEVKTFQRMIN